MLKSISKKKVIVINLISMVMALIGYAYFLRINHNNDFNNYFAIVLYLLSFFDNIIAISGLKSIFVLNQDKYESKDPTYQLTILTIVMSVIVIVATITFELFII